jgi:hypothetical protein
MLVRKSITRLQLSGMLKLVTQMRTWPHVHRLCVCVCVCVCGSYDRSFVVTSSIRIMYWRWIIPCNAFEDNGWLLHIWTLFLQYLRTTFPTGFYLHVTCSRLPSYNLPVWPTNFVSADDSTMRFNPEDCIQLWKPQIVLLCSLIKYFLHFSFRVMWQGRHVDWAMFAFF